MRGVSPTIILTHNNGHYVIIQKYYVNLLYCVASTTGNDVIMDGCDIIIQCSIFRSNNCFLNYERQNSLNEVIIQPGFTHRLSSREILTVNIITSNGSVTMTQSVHTSGKNYNEKLKFAFIAMLMYNVFN